MEEQFEEYSFSEMLEMIKLTALIPGEDGDMYCGACCDSQKKITIEEFLSRKPNKVIWVPK